MTPNDHTDDEEITHPHRPRTVPLRTGSEAIAHPEGLPGAEATGVEGEATARAETRASGEATPSAGASLSPSRPTTAVGEAGGFGEATEGEWQSHRRSSHGEGRARSEHDDATGGRTSQYIVDDDTTT